MDLVHLQLKLCGCTYNVHVHGHGHVYTNVPLYCIMSSYVILLHVSRSTDQKIKLHGVFNALPFQKFWVSNRKLVL